VSFVADSIKFEFSDIDNIARLLINNQHVSSIGYQIVSSDEWISENYVILFNIKTVDHYQNNGFAKLLLRRTINYIKNVLHIRIITLIVDKDNRKAISLYTGVGFEVYVEYDAEYCLIKKL
jgi:ribosomal protein S18 acetylase RimI-like enzyme